MILRFVCAPCALILHPFTPKAHTESAHGFDGKTLQQIAGDCNENSPCPGHALRQEHERAEERIAVYECQYDTISTEVRISNELNICLCKRTS